MDYTYGGLNRVGTMFERYENEEKKVLQPFDAAKNMWSGLSEGKVYQLGLSTSIQRL